MNSRIYCVGFQHPHVRRVYSYIKGKSREPTDRVVVVGRRDNSVALRAGNFVDTLLYCPELDGEPRSEELAVALAARAKHNHVVSAKTMHRLVPERTPPIVSLCWYRCLRSKDLKPGPKSLIVVVDGIRMIGNIGCIVRSANAAGADLIAFTNRNVRLNNPRIVTTSCGTIMDTPILDSTIDDIALKLLSLRYSILLADAEKGERYDTISYDGRVALVLGSEHSGISKSWNRYATLSVHIPTRGTADSLNVAVAGSIILFFASRQMGWSGDKEAWQSCADHLNELGCSIVPVRK